MLFLSRCISIPAHCSASPLAFLHLASRRKEGGWPMGFLRHASFDQSAVPAWRAVLGTILLWLRVGNEP